MTSLEERLHSYEPLWGQWKIGRRIYAGGHSAVFELERVRCDKVVRSAVKVTELCQMPEGELNRCFERAVDEIERMELLSGCSHVVTVYDDEIREWKDDALGARGLDILIRMEYLSCLSDRMRDGEIFSEREIVKLGMDVCQALSQAHEMGVVHRDIKPANLFRSQEGAYKLGDFGAAGSVWGGRMLETIAGTAAYMAPEVARGDVYGPAADLYSLGIVLYQMLNYNFLPLTGDGSSYSEREEAVRRRQRGVELEPAPRGSRELNEAVLRACSPEPDKRFGSAEEFFRALALTPEAVDPVGSPDRLEKGNAIRGIRKKRSGRKELSVGVAAVLCAGCLILGTVISGAFFAGQSPLSNGGTYYPSPEQEGAETLSESRYEVISQNITWNDAKVYCESRGGHLASVTSRKEEEVVLELLEEKGVVAAWIGADNRNSSKGFKWLTDERFAYAAWGLNEPNNALGVEYYLMLVKSDTQGWVWNDSRDDGLSMFPEGQVGFICEWDEEEP